MTANNASEAVIPIASTSHGNTLHGRARVALSATAFISHKVYCNLVSRCTKPGARPRTTFPAGEELKKAGLLRPFRSVESRSGPLCPDGGIGECRVLLPNGSVGKRGI